MTVAFGMLVVVIRCGRMYAQSSASPEPFEILLRADLIRVGIVSGASNPSMGGLDARYEGSCALGTGLPPFKGSFETTTGGALVRILHPFPMEALDR
jgi:hypothetical protein